MDRIDLVDMKLDCVLGVLDREQRTEQPVVGEISMWLDLDRSGHTGHLYETVNYADVAAWASFITQRGRFRLLESVSVAVLRLMLLPPAPLEQRAQLERARIQLRKPTILGELATPGTRFERDRDWALVDGLSPATGIDVEVLVDTGRSAAWRIHIDPQTEWPVLPDHAVFVISGEAEAGDGVTISAGTHAPAGQWTLLRNRTDGVCTLLVVRVPELPIGPPHNGVARW